MRLGAMHDGRDASLPSVHVRSTIHDVPQGVNSCGAAVIHGAANSFFICIDMDCPFPVILRLCRRISERKHASVPRSLVTALLGMTAGNELCHAAHELTFRSRIVLRT